MSTRINLVNHESATGKPKELLDAVQSAMGSVPNLFKVLAQSPESLDAFLTFSGKASQGVLSAQDRERVAIAVAQANRCEYCLSAHTVLGKMAGLGDEEAKRNRSADSSEARSKAILDFAVSIVDEKGHLSDEQINRARAAGLSDKDLIDTLTVTVVNIFTNYINHIANTPIDFPVVSLEPALA